MTAPATDELIAEIKAGLEGVTPGPWRVPGKRTPYVFRDGGDDYGSVHVAECGNDRDKEIARYNLPRWLADAHHIARCSPDKIAAVLARLEAAEAENKRLREALQPLRAAANALDGRHVEPDERRWPGEIPMLTVAELRRARAALEGK